MNERELTALIETIAPPALAAPWDNGGYQIHCRDREVTRLLLCLDVTDAVAEEAVALGADYILAHHPLSLSGVKALDEDAPLGGRMMKLARAGITVYGAHTAFDFAPEGNNAFLASMLGLTDTELLTEAGETVGIAGLLLEPLPLEALRRTVGERLALGEAPKTAGPRDRIIRKLAICTGSGMDAAGAALAAGADCLLTGDVKHHSALEALEQGLCIIDGGHYGTEAVFKENMGALLRRGLSEAGAEGVEIILSGVDTDPFSGSFGSAPSGKRQHR